MHADAPGPTYIHSVETPRLQIVIQTEAIDTSVNLFTMEAKRRLNRVE